MGLKIKSTDETHVYISQSGYLAIKQVDHLGEDAVVVLSPDQARIVADELYRQLEDTSWWDAVETDDTEESLDHVTRLNLQSAAEREQSARIIQQMNIDSSKKG